jgi:hypothetical protein
MLAKNFDLKMLVGMRHSPIENYVIPGLTSWLIGHAGPMGCVRMFECSRDQMEFITPHSHRFDFQCVVLSGKVENSIWYKDFTGDWYQSTDITYKDIGVYEGSIGGIDRWKPSSRFYEIGDCYQMNSSQIHSIRFYKDSQVLFFEGKQISEKSKILEPHVKGRTIPTFRTEPWMFYSRTSLHPKTAGGR